MLSEECLQLGLGRLGRLGDVLADELHLLAQPTTDDDVVALEAEREGLAIEDLLLTWSSIRPSSPAGSAAGATSA